MFLAFETLPSFLHPFFLLLCSTLYYALYDFLSLCVCVSAVFRTLSFFRLLSFVITFLYLIRSFGRYRRWLGLCIEMFLTEPGFAFVERSVEPLTKTRTDL